MAENHVNSKHQQWQIPLKKSSFYVRLSLQFLLMLIRWAWNLKQIPRKNNSNMPIVCDLWTKIWLKRLLTSKWKFWLIFNNPLTRSLPRSRKRHVAFIFLGKKCEQHAHWEDEWHLTCTMQAWKLKCMFVVIMYMQQKQLGYVDMAPRF